MLAASFLLISSPLLCHSLGLVSHQLHDLTPAPYLNKHHSSQYSAPAFLGYRDKPINVYRDTSDITDQAELTDAIRTQDKDHLVSLPYRSPFFGSPGLPVTPTDRSLYSRKIELDYLNALNIPRGKPQVYKYNVAAVPDCAVTNKHFYNISFCLEDPHYPVTSRDTIKFELDRNMHIVDRLLSDISYQSADNLVDGLTKYQEENYNFRHYGTHNTHHHHQYYKGFPAEHHSDGGYVCPSDIFYGRPKRGENTFGEWKVIVNLPDSYYGSHYQKYTQTTRLEQCIHPEAPCSFISPGYGSSCLQKHNFVRLLAYTFDKGLHIDSFKLPVACSCHVSPGLGIARLVPSPVSPPAPPVMVSEMTTSPPPSGPTNLPAVITSPLYRPLSSSSLSSPNPYKVNLG